MIPLSPRTHQHLRVLFSEADVTAAEQLLAEECADKLPLVTDPSPASLERLRFAALRLSGGRLAKLRGALALAKADWRDLLMASGFGHDVTAHERWEPIPLTRDELDLWRTGKRVHGALFPPRAHVEMALDWAAGQEGEVQDLLRVDPEPVYEVLLTDGSRVEAPQSCLRVAG